MCDRPVRLSPDPFESSGPAQRDRQSLKITRFHQLFACFFCAETENGISSRRRRPRGATGPAAAATPDTGTSWAPTTPTSPPPRSPPSRTASWLDIAAEAENKSKDDSSLDALLRPKPAVTVKRSASFCAKKGSSSASLLLCTEGLGYESTVDADDMFKDGDAEAEAAALKGAADGSDAGADAGAAEVAKEEERQPKTFPPPIRSIGRGGKPYVCFMSFREDGRFVLLERVIPGKELLQATREGGRLRLQFAVATAAAAAAAAGVSVDEAVHGGDDDDPVERTHT